MAWLDQEPARGDFPSPGFLALPGIDRISGPGRALQPPPPIHYLLGLAPVDGGDGFSVFEMPAHPWLQTGAGVFLAGVSALVCDAPLGAAIISKLAPGGYGATSELSMSFLRPASLESKVLRARAEVIDVGRSLGLSQSVVEDAAGQVLAHVTSRYYLRQIHIPDGTELPEPFTQPSYDTPDPYQRPMTLPLETSSLQRLSGLDYFRGVASGDIAAAPFAELLGLRVREASEGEAVFTLGASEWFLSPARTIYGGILAFLADIAMTAAVGTTLPAGSSSATLDLKAHFLRPGIADGREITVRGSVVHRGKTLAVTRAEVLNADGKALIMATGSTMLLPGRPWQSIAVADEPAFDEES